MPNNINLSISHERSNKLRRKKRFSRKITISQKNANSIRLTL